MYEYAGLGTGPFGTETTGAGRMVLLWGDLTEDVGTCWNARVTSYEDILDKPGPDGGGVPPSSDLTSWIVNGTAVRSSAIPSKEFTEGKAALSDA